LTPSRPTEVEDVLATMLLHQVRTVFVTDHGRLVGSLSRDAIVPSGTSLADHWEDRVIDCLAEPGAEPPAEVGWRDAPEQTGPLVMA
jgi:hypothetical protein